MLSGPCQPLQTAPRSSKRPARGHWGQRAYPCDTTLYPHAASLASVLYIALIASDSEKCRDTIGACLSRTDDTQAHPCDASLAWSLTERCCAPLLGAPPPLPPPPPPPPPVLGAFFFLAALQRWQMDVQRQQGLCRQLLVLSCPKIPTG